MIIDITPHLKTPPSFDKRAEVEALARELGGVVLWNDGTDNLSMREAEALTHLDWRVAKKPQQIAEALCVTRDRAKQLLGILKRKGYAARLGHYHYGGWIKCRDTHPQTQAA